MDNSQQKKDMDSPIKKSKCDTYQVLSTLSMLSDWVYDRISNGYGDEFAEGQRNAYEGVIDKIEEIKSKISGDSLPPSTSDDRDGIIT